MASATAGSAIKLKYSPLITGSVVDLYLPHHDGYHTGATTSFQHSQMPASRRAPELRNDHCLPSVIVPLSL